MERGGACTALSTGPGPISACVLHPLAGFFLSFFFKNLTTSVFLSPSGLYQRSAVGVQAEQGDSVLCWRPSQPL